MSAEGVWTRSLTGSFLVVPLITPKLNCYDFSLADTGAEMAVPAVNEPGMKKKKIWLKENNVRAGSLV
jgi:hypothetical protein